MLHPALPLRFYWRLTAFLEIGFLIKALVAELHPRPSRLFLVRV